MRRRSPAVLAVLFLALPATGLARTTIGVAPLTSTSGPEYQWIGPALAGALALRIHQQPELNMLTLRQVNAAMRHDGIAGDSLTSLDEAVSLGRQLGADILVAGTFTAAWPDIELIVKIFDPQNKKLLNTHIISGGLDDLLDIEARIAKALALELGAEQPDIARGAFGTDDVRAWRFTTLALEILNWQSLAPRSADPSTPLRLPASAVKKAREYLEEATRHDPNFGEAWAALGVSQALVGETTAAWRSFGKATALGSGHHPTAVLGASFVRMREGRFDEAAQILENAVARYPGFSHARGYLGEIYLHLGRYKEALRAFDEYAVSVPKQPWVLAQRAYAKSKLKDFNGAIADSIAAVDILPGSTFLLLELASRYIDAKKLFGAEEALRTVIDRHPDNPTAYVRLGYVYLLQGQDDQVIPVTEQALANIDFASHGRDRAYAHLNLVRAYGHKGELDKAFEHLAEAKATGTVFLEELTADPALADLRQDARFGKLVR